MRVLVLTSSWPSVQAPYNGIFISDHCRALKRAGHEVSVIAPRVFAGRERTGAPGIPVSRFWYPSGDRLLSEFSRTPILRMLVYLLSGAVSATAAARRCRADVLLVHWVVPTGPIGAIVSALTGIPLVVYAHGGDLARSRGGLIRRIAATVVRRATAVVCVNEGLRRQVVDDLGGTATATRVIPMGVDLGVFSQGDRAEARASWGLSNDDDVVLFVGNVSAAKGVPELMQAMSVVAQRRPNARLVLAGRGPLFGDVPTMAVGEGLDSERVLALGAVDHDELPRLMSAADVVTLPSHAEGLPVSLVEAAAVGVPVVASDVGGVSSVVALDDRSTLVSPGDPCGLADAIVAVLELDDRSRRSRVLAGGEMDTDANIERLMRIMCQASLRRD